MGSYSPVVPMLATKFLLPPNEVPTMSHELPVDGENVKDKQVKSDEN